MSRLPSRSLLLLDDLSHVASPGWSVHTSRTQHGSTQGSGRQTQGTDSSATTGRKENTITDVVCVSQGESPVRHAETRLRDVLSVFMVTNRCVINGLRSRKAAAPGNKGHAPAPESGHGCVPVTSLPTLARRERSAETMLRQNAFSLHAQAARSDGELRSYGT